MSIYHIPWFKKANFGHEIVPIFIPFAGCAERCIFCAQEVQSGKSSLSSSADIKAYLQQIRRTLIERKNAQKPPAEIAFYGGTFTSLPSEHFDLCVDFAEEMIQKNLCISARCSTRPDSVLGESNVRLLQMREAGFKCIELGVQSFNDAALVLSKRRYNKICIEEVARHIKALGFTLGMQLMPGMPGVTEEIFSHDVQQAIALCADFLRFYPCQVIEGTELALLWTLGRYSVWSLETCIEALSAAWLVAQKAQIPVIRMGLAPEARLEEHILAGPRHAALGNMIQAAALHKHITSFIQEGQSVQRLILPTFTQGYFWGHAQTLRTSWAKHGVGVENISWHEFEYIELRIH